MIGGYGVCLAKKACFLGPDPAYSVSYVDVIQRAETNTASISTSSLSAVPAMHPP